MPIGLLAADDSHSRVADPRALHSWRAVVLLKVHSAHYQERDRGSTKIQRQRRTIMKTVHWGAGRKKVRKNWLYRREGRGDA